jgi:hypothetical protein
MNDSDVPEDRTAFDFAMASGAARFEWVGFNDKVTIEAGAEVQLKFVVNPSNAYVPTGEAAAIAGKGSLNLMDTRAGYVKEPENFTLVNITKEQEGLYVATIRCLEYDPDITDYAMALVLNTGTEAAPILISSPTFVLGAATSVEWSFDDGTLTITGTGAMPDYIDLDDIPWNVHRAEIETVVIADGVTSIGISAFNDCTALTGITIPASVTSIGEGAFYNCTSLTDVTIPDGVTSIERHTFHDCSALAHITIPNHVETIWDGAFESCIALESVTIGSGVTTIKWYVFSDCPTLKNVTCLATTPPTLDGYNFGGTGTDVLHVPAASVNAYKNVTVWNNAFASIEAI